MSSRRFAELRFPEVAERVGPTSVLVQPVGAVEQHGPHLPLVTDLLIASAAADAVVEERGEDLDLWLLPPLAYTKSNEHAWAPGSIWLGPATLLAVLDDLGRSLAATRATKVVFLNGHGGNSSLLNVACRELRLHHGLETFLTHPSVPPDQGGASTAEELGMGIHAGLTETSVVLHLRPDLVRMDLAARNVPEHLAANRHVRFGGAVSFGWLADDFGPDGHIGDPTAATAELGKGLFEAAVARLGEQFEEVSRFRFAAPAEASTWRRASPGATKAVPRDAPDNIR
ncbi:MAG: creatininase family protein [Acidimicrobiia bacterium]|nr:creatininase family protein [Acidimicrobiia bacterium]